MTVGFFVVVALRIARKQVHLDLLPAAFYPLRETNLTPVTVKKMVDAANFCWQAICEKDTEKLGKGLSLSRCATVDAFPGTLTEELAGCMAVYDDLAFGRNISGAGGGGYLTLVTEKETPKGIRVNVRR